MNITKIISQGKYSNLGTCLKLTINFKQQEITGYDMTGRPTYHYADKDQSVYGVTKAECKAKARQVLIVETYTQKRCVVRSHHVSVSRMGVIW